MNLEEDKKNLKEQILALSSIYTKKRLSTKFIKGETFIPASGATLEEAEVNNIIDAALNGWATEGEYSKKFSRGLREYMNSRFCVLCNSGSSANLLAVTTVCQKEFGNKAAKEGDEFITAAVGFPTTVSPLVQNKITPVFVDINPVSLTPNVELIEQAVVEGKTKGIILAHALGSPFDVDTIRDICNEYGLWMIEDCSDALGSRYNGQLVGTQGSMATMSFFPAHHITTGQGGAVFTNDGLSKKMLESLRNWGRSCFPAGTKIEANGVLKNIEDVVIGDAVVSHTGNLRRVTELTGKKDTSFIRIKSRLMKEVTCTSNHPVFVQTTFNSKPIKMFVPAESLTKNDFTLEALPVPIGSSPTEFVYSYDTLYETKENRLKIEPDLMRLVGYWLAEGSLASGLKGGKGYKENKYKFYRVDFAFNMREEETIDDVCNLMYKFFGVVGQVRQSKKDSFGASLTFKTRKGYEFFGQFFGRGAKNKRLPYNMNCWDLSLGLDQLIRGLWVGDGSSSKQGFSVGLISETLIHQVRRLLLRYGVVGSYWERKPESHTPSVISGKVVVSKNTYYSLNFYGNNAERFGKVIGENFESKTKDRQEKVFFDETYVYYPIEKIEAVSYDKPVVVYNLEVEIDHSYHANGIAVHNCWCIPGKDNTCGKRFEWCIGDEIEYDHKYVFDRLGYNLQMTDLQAAIGLAQLDKIPRFEAQRKRNWNRLKEALSEYKKSFILPQPIAGADPSWFGFHLTVKEASGFTRREITEYLESKKIGTRLLFGGNLLQQPAFHHIPHKVFGTLEDSNLITRGTFWLGVHGGINDEKMDYVIETIREFMLRHK